ncbi:MAG: protein translocase subunit SecF [Ruminococcus sp.]|nr:protein translocase subunit SecF [Ruminococcus sp.]
MKKDLNFIGKKKIFFGISLAIIAIGLICNIIFGVTLDIQFKGGTIVNYSFVGEIDDAKLKDTIQTATPEHQVSFTITKDIMNNTDEEQAYAVSIQFSGNESVSSDVMQGITTALEEAFPDNNFQYKENSSVEAAMGLKFLLKCLTAVAIASVLMVIYVTIRFKRIGGLSAGVMALVALFHDVAMIYFMYVIFRMPIDSSFIAVVLMIIGYSLNDTIVIYDRVREERRLAGPKADIADVFNHSATAVMGRTIATSVTTLVAIGTVYVVALVFNLASVQAFALPMMIGIVSGCYSSLCIAGPLWVTWNKRGEKKEAADKTEA